MLTILDKNNTTDNLVYAGRLPTDFRTRDEIFNKSIGNLPPPMPMSEIPPPNRKKFGGGQDVKISLKFNEAKLGALPRYGEKNPVLPKETCAPISTSATFSAATCSRIRATTILASATRPQARSNTRCGFKACG